ncbi:MAG: hypothetical protein IJY55_05165 [Clostridia bacterium]|nr:hypothetical protein [Clostridia bacterium]
MNNNNIPNIPDGFIPIEPDKAMRNFQKNIDPSVIQPNFDYERLNQEYRKQIDSLSTFEDRVKYANKKANKGTTWKAIVTGVIVGLILLVVEYHKEIWDFILSLMP